MPESSQIVKQDFFDYNIVTDKKIVVIGNPPFGRASSLAIKFFNKAASLKSTEIIAFILPKTFRKISVQTKLNDYFELVKDIDLEKNAFTFNSLSYDVPSCFQIWKRTQKPRQNIDIQNIYIDFVKKDLSEFAIRRVGGRAGKILYGKDYNENSTYFCREKIDGIVKILEKIDFSKVVNSTAGQKSLAKKEIIIALHNYLSQSKDNYANI